MSNSTNNTMVIYGKMKLKKNLYTLFSTTESRVKVDDSWVKRPLTNPPKPFKVPCGGLLHFGVNAAWAVFTYKEEGWIIV